MPDVRVVHRDQQLLVLDKPPGLATTSPGGGECLMRMARALDPDAPALHASSRLDADVSGLVTFTRTRQENRRLLAARRAGRYRRAYLALAAAAPDEASGRWSWPIALHPRDKRLRAALGRAEAGGRGAREALTDYRVLWAGPHAALLWLEPQTGRTHQLRVHAARAGCALLGDRPYGGSGRLVLSDGRALSLRRTMLHCIRVALPAPGPRASALRLSAPPPPDFMRVVSAFELGQLSERFPAWWSD